MRLMTTVTLQLPHEKLSPISIGSAESALRALASPTSAYSFLYTTCHSP